MPKYECHVPECEFETLDVADAVAAVQMAHHLQIMHNPTGVQASNAKAPPIYLSLVWFGLVWLNVAISISSLVVGYSYDSACNNGADKYLLYSGVLGVAYIALALAFHISSCFSPCIGRCISLLYILTLFMNLAIFIWGCFVIFPAHSQWTHDVGEDLNTEYCHEFPMLFAFILLIINAVGGCIGLIINAVGRCFLRMGEILESRTNESLGPMRV